MKRLVLALALCAFAFASCGDDDENGGSSSFFDGTITGTLKNMNWNWEDYTYTFADITTEVDEIHAIIYNEETEESEVFCSATVTNGKFSIKLPTPSAKYLDAIGGAQGVTVSDVTAKITSVYFRCSKNGEENGYPDMYPANPNDEIDIEFMYADRDFTIKGSLVDTDDGVTYTEEYNVNLKKGWNTIIYREISDTKGTVTTESIPANMFWGASIYDLGNDDWDYEEGNYTETKRGFKSFGK